MVSTGSARRDGSPSGAKPSAEADFDPFDDLARLLEEPWSEEFPIGAKAAGAARAPAVPPSDEAFEAAFAAEFSKVTPGRKAFEAATPARSGGAFEVSEDFVSALSPPAARTGGPTSPWPPKAAEPKRKGPASALEAEIEEEIEDAVQGLSAPANPRGTTPHRSESFAPERRVAHEEPTLSAGATAAIDDFDALIASELAVLAQDRAFLRDVDHAASADSMHAPPRIERASAAAIHEVHPEALTAERRGRRAAGRGSRIGRMLTVGTGLAAMVAGGLYLSGTLSGAGGFVGGGEPILVKADAEPVKIVPKDPGGTSVPNQNKAVYERVQSASVPTPTPQGELRVDAEEPMELAPEQEEASISEALPGVSFYEDAPGTTVAAAPDAAPAEPQPVLQPRRVRAMTVRPDGTLVAAAETAAPSVLVPTASRAVEVASADAREAMSVAPSPTAEMITSSTVRAAPPAPRVDEPMPVAAEPAESADEVAALLPPTEPEAPAAAAQEPAPAGAEAAVPAAPAIDPASYGGYYVQISSQPSAEAAQTSSASLRKRYAELLGSHDVVIQPAEIPGKGTYHRVRVLAGTQNEASSLCEALKSAGGSCFVSR